MIPQLIYLSLGLVGLGFAIAKHGEEKTGKENAWINTIVQLFIWTLLYWGGFFDVLIANW